MSNIKIPKGKIVRRFGVNIYGNPKYDRILHRKPNSPGAHAGKKGRRKTSDYGIQLTEKQKLKYHYGIGEKQFRVTFERAQKRKGITGDNLLILLESRLDSVLYKMGMAPTRDAARQLISHGHMKINGRKVNIPSIRLKENDEITVKESSRSKALVQRYLEEKRSTDLPEWVVVDKEQLKGQLLRPPMRSEIHTVANEQLVVELYSK